MVIRWIMEWRLGCYVLGTHVSCCRSQSLRACPSQRHLMIKSSTAILEPLSVRWRSRPTMAFSPRWNRTAWIIAMAAAPLFARSTPMMAASTFLRHGRSSAWKPGALDGRGGDCSVTPPCAPEGPAWLGPAIGSWMFSGRGEGNVEINR